MCAVVKIMEISWREKPPLCCAWHGNIHSNYCKWFMCTYYIYIIYIEIYNPSYKLGENVWFVDLRLRLQLTKCFVGIYPTIELIIPIIQ